MKRKNKLAMLMFAFVFLILAIPVTNVQAAADAGNLVPSVGSGLVDTPVYYKCTALIAGTLYSVEVGGIVQHTGLEATTAGEIQFEVSVSISGLYSVVVKNSSSLAVATGSLRVTDLVETIMPYVVLLVTITVLFGVVDKIKV